MYKAIKSNDGKFELESNRLSSLAHPSSFILTTETLSRLQSAHIIIIVSSLSGAGYATTAYDNVFAPLMKILSIDTTVHKTTSKISHCQFIESSPFSANSENIIVIFGGDTMVYDVLNSLSKNSFLTSSHQFTLSLLPCGTGNALSTSLGITSIPVGISRFFGISGTSEVETPTLPVMKIAIQDRGSERTIWSTVVCSWGLHASLVADSDTPEMRREYGPKRFEVYLQLTLLMAGCCRETPKSCSSRLPWKCDDKWG